MENQYLVPNLQLTISTYEKVPESNKFIATVSHTFHGDTEEEIFQILSAHRMTDTFFDSSFRGIFYWRDGIIILKNSPAKVCFP